MRNKRQFLEQWVQSVSQDTNADKRWDRSDDPKEFTGTPVLFAFVDMDYYCLWAPLTWIPSPYRQRSITVPKGFITDFASVPKVFWSLLPPTGRYGYAALFHDYVYWDQALTRAEADKVFSETMIELRVSFLTRSVLYTAVRLFGFVAWRGNARLKARGEKRILKRIPRDINTTWKDWKQKPGVF